MEDLKLSEAQSRYYGDLFLCCCDKNEASGKVSYEQATELFRSANLNADLVRQILRIAKIGDGMSQISRRQFYSCLKLIAACQAGFAPAALNQDTLHEDISPMALPRFSWFGANDVKRDGSANLLNNGSTTSGHSTATATNGQSSSAALMPGKTTDLIELSHTASRSGGQSSTVITASATAPADRNSTSAAAAVHSEQPSTDSEVEQNDDSSAIENSDGRRKYGSPSAWSTGSESPTPTNSVAMKGGKTNLWHGLLCEEQRQLLGTEEESSDRHSSDDDPNEAEVQSSSHQLHAAANDELLYTITEDQRAYYTKQYQVVQKDGVGNVSGPVARVFFEKSRIPVEELRHVWKLCDATKDGALSEAEFMAAMHLVVLRRNNIPLPMRLPKCLHASCILIGGVAPAPPPAPVQMQEADLLHLHDDDDAAEEDVDATKDRDQESSVNDETDTGLENTLDCGPESINSVAEDRGTNKSSASSQVPSHLPPVAARTMPPPPLANTGTGESAGDWNVSQASSAAWTKFNESPTATATSVPSPGPKPVHFDIQWTVQAVGADPQILHPVALRLTPQGAEAIQSSSSSGSGKDRETSASPTKLQNLNTSTATGVEFRPIQRPQAKKVKQVTGVGALPPPPVRDPQNMMNMSMDSAAVLSSIRSSTTASSPDEDNSSGGSGAQPPIPPPRLPITRHTRSSSLDLNKLLLQSNAAVPQSSSSLLPEVPPRDPPHFVQTQLSCDSKLESTFADFSRFAEAAKQPPQQQKTLTKTNKPTIPSKRTSAFEVYRKPIPQQLSPVILDQEMKVAHLEDMLRSLSLDNNNSNNSNSSGGSLRVNAESTMQQLKEQNSVLVNLCLELGNELFAMKYKREEMAQRLQQVDFGNRTIEATTAATTAVTTGTVTAASAAGGQAPRVGGAGQIQ